MKVGTLTFDEVEYDAPSDYLYLGGEAPATATPEGHWWLINERNELVGLMLTGARYLLARDGKITVTLPDGQVAVVEDVAEAVGLAPTS